MSGREAEAFHFLREFEAQLVGLVVGEPFRHVRKDDPPDALLLLGPRHIGRGARGFKDAVQAPADAVGIGQDVGLALLIGSRARMLDLDNC